MLGMVGDTPGEARIEPAVIDSVVTAGASDGRPLVSIEWRDLVVQVPYLAYAYTSGDVGVVVAVLVQGTQLLVLGPIWGTPPDPVLTPDLAPPL